MGERRYNEKELAQILRSAAAAQSKNSLATNEDSGSFSQSDIERLAAEVGIDRQYIASTLENFDSPSSPSKFNFWGAPSTKIIERTIDGTLDDEGWQEMVAELRKTFGGAGTVSEVGSSREWMGGSEFRSVHLSATPKNGKTRLRLSLGQEGGLVVGWMLAFCFSILGSIPLGILLGKSGLFPLGILAAVLGLIFTTLVVTRAVLSRWNSRFIIDADVMLSRFKSFSSTGNLESRLSESSKNIESNVSELTDGNSK